MSPALHFSLVSFGIGADRQCGTGCLPTVSVPLLPLQHIHLITGWVLSLLGTKKRSWGCRQEGNRRCGGISWGSGSTLLCARAGTSSKVPSVLTAVPCLRLFLVPLQPFQTTCGAPSGLRGRSCAICISFPLNTAVSGAQFGGGGRGLWFSVWPLRVCSLVPLELKLSAKRRSCDCGWSCQHRR